MARITLLRHGKAEEPSHSTADFDRALSSRGVSSARKMGLFLKEQRMLPDLILASPAQRTRQTYELATESWPDIPCQFVDSIYEASASGLMFLLEEQAAHIENVMIIGHNPSLVVLLNHMVDPRHNDGNLSYFPTCCMADLGFADRTIGTIEPGEGRLLSMVRVRDLAR